VVLELLHLAPVNSAETIKILSVSASDADHAALCTILQEPKTNLETQCRWVVHSVSTVASTVEALAQEEIPIIISECNLSAATWQMVLQTISPLPDPPLLIVASRLADEHLWAEALNLGAWDVLAKPFDTEEVTRVVASAWLNWQDRHALRTKQKAGNRNIRHYRDEPDGRYRSR